MAPAEQEFGKNVFSTNLIELSRSYGGDSLYVLVNVDEQIAVKTLHGKSGVANRFCKQSTNAKGITSFAFEQRAKEQLAQQTAAQNSANAITDPQAKAKALDEANKLVESQAAKQLRAKLPPLIESGLGLHLWRTYLSKSFPKFLYFDEYYQMEGQANISALKSDRQTTKCLIQIVPCLA